jgi:hypothetical protein
MAAYATPAPDDPFAATRDVLEGLIAELSGPGADRLTADQAEELIDRKARELARQAQENHFGLRALREELRAVRNPGPREGADGIARTRLEPGRKRWLATLFGKVRVPRCAWRRPGVPDYLPADAELSLPAGRHSHTLAKLACLELARGSYESGHEAISRRCGKVIGKRQAGEIIVNGASDIGDFYRSRVPVPCTRESVLVLSADMKGVVMRAEALREATARAAGKKGKMRTRLSAGEKANRKRMAALVTVYDAEPAPRRPQDVIAPPGGRSGDRELRRGPEAANRWLAGSVAEDPAVMIAAMFDEAEARDPGHLRTWVVLVDGAEHQLALIRAEAAARGVTVHVIIDIIHVLEYIWGAAWCFHAQEEAAAAEDWVAVTALAVLAGGSERAAGEIAARAAGLDPGGRKGADACVRYLENRHDLLRYDQALDAGWPIATGVIEGACRHIVGDRLGHGGCRWGLDGAEAVLSLRAVIANGDFEEYWQYHLSREHQRLYPGTVRARYAPAA